MAKKSEKVEQETVEVVVMTPEQIKQQEELSKDLINKIVEEQDPVKYGLKPTNATMMLSNLAPLLIERQALTVLYAQTITLEVTKENTKTFKELRTKIRDNRKAIEKWHKLEKDFYLQGGRFVDSIKNKEIAVNEGMEDKLEECEKFFENQEKERIEKLVKERIELLKPYIDNPEMYPLAQLDEIAFDNLKNGLELQFKEKERIRIENEKKQEQENENAKLRELRKNELIPYWNLMPDQHKAADFAKYTIEQWNAIISALKNKKEQEDKRIAEIEAKNKLIQSRHSELAPLMLFLEIEYEKVINLPEAEYKQQLEKATEKKSKHDLEQAELKRKADEAQKLKQENEKLKETVKMGSFGSGSISVNRVMESVNVSPIIETNFDKLTWIRVNAFFDSIKTPNCTDDIKEHPLVQKFIEEHNNLVAAFKLKMEELKG